MEYLTSDDIDFYGKEIYRLKSAQNQILDKIESFRKSQVVKKLADPVEYCKSRIKSFKSMKDKLSKRELPITPEAALSEVTDVVGIRVICDFIDDVYAVADYLKNQSDILLEKEVDYIKFPKSNGYRSYHLVVQINCGIAKGIFVEVQIRTMAIDCWASLEHQMKYKHQIKNQKLIVSELKRCADEIASTDLSLQTIRELIAADE